MRPFDLSFSDTKVAFQHMSTAEIKKAKFIFTLFKFPILVKYGPGLSTICLKIGLPIKGIIKNTVFWQFCGGETIDECDYTVKTLWKNGVGTILDYSVEGHENEESFDKNVEEIKDTILKATGKPEYPFCVFKPTGIASVALLERMDAGKKLDHEELDLYYKTKKRFETLCQAAADNDMRLFVDAELSWIQKSVDSIVNEMMAKHNHKKALIFNTVQLYKKGQVDLIRKWITEAREKKYFLGFKLVRGAYMEKEAERALKMGYPNPINDTKEDSDRDYDEALKLCFENSDIVSVCAGTHNEESSLYLAKLMNEAEIENNDPRFWFAQLFGMSDNISFSLAARHYNVVKYLPYGPIKAVMPYLGRRAKENSSMAGQMGRELAMLVQELKRRKAE